MTRFLVAFLMLACPAVLPAQEAWIEQFDGKTLQGWEIDGQGVVENGQIKLGGAGGATLRLTARLGDKFSIRLEYEYAGPIVPNITWQTNAAYPCQWGFQSAANRQSEATFDVVQGGWMTANRASYKFRTLDGSSSGSGGLMAGVGPARDITIVVQPNSTLTIHRISLQTTPPPPPVGTPWIAIAVLVGLLVSVMALGWFLNRRRSATDAAGRPT